MQRANACGRVARGCEREREENSVCFYEIVIGIAAIFRGRGEPTIVPATSKYLWATLSSLQILPETRHSLVR